MPLSLTVYKLNEEARARWQPKDKRGRVKRSV